MRWIPNLEAASEPSGGAATVGNIQHHKPSLEIGSKELEKEMKKTK
jgi:hypothetical protein